MQYHYSSTRLSGQHLCNPLDGSIHLFISYVKVHRCV